MNLPTAAEITAWHDGWLAQAPQLPRPSDPLWSAIEANHLHNCALWEQEDLARRRDVADSEIAGNKRAIDASNQKRNDAIERIDETLLEQLKEVRPAANARLNSETAGAMVDRLSILSLKVHHMRIQAGRPEASAGHRDACAAKLVRLQQQRVDLAECFDRLLAEAARGESYFKVYRQFKMYNDPELNPALYGGKR
jgi:hypothetical protein